MKKQTEYFIKQKLLGIGLLLISAFAIFIMKEAIVSLITIPLGLLLIFSKRMIWKNDYFYEVMDNKEDWD